MYNVNITIHYICIYESWQPTLLIRHWHLHRIPPHAPHQAASGKEDEETSGESEDNLLSKADVHLQRKSYIYFCIWLYDYILYDRFLLHHHHHHHHHQQQQQHQQLLYTVLYTNDTRLCKPHWGISNNFSFLIQKNQQKSTLILFLTTTSHQPSSTCFTRFFPSDVFDVPSFIWPSSKLRLRA